MEHYYFIQKSGIKQGPFKLADLKLQTIYFDELIWRSDNDLWKKASEFEELQDVFIIKPPLTPIEGKRKEFNNHFIATILPYSLGIYVSISLLITLISFSIANKGWEDVKNKYIVKHEEMDFSQYQRSKIKLDSISSKLKVVRDQFNNYAKIAAPFFLKVKANQDLTKSETDAIHSYYDYDVEIYYLTLDSMTLAAKNDSFFSSNPQRNIPIYNIPENIISLENIYGLQQPFLFRTYYAFFSKIYLTREEQTDSGKLFLNIALSSFLSLLMLVIVILVAYYFIKSANIND